MNKAQLIGNLGADPEVRYMPNGDAAVSFRIATNKRWTDKEGKKQEHTEWHSCTMFGKRGEALAKYSHKGSKIYVEGELRTRKWTDKNNVDRWTTEIRVYDFEFLESKGTGRPPHPAEAGNYPGERTDGDPGPQSAPPNTKETDASHVAPPAEVDEDDIPF